MQTVDITKLQSRYFRQNQSNTTNYKNGKDTHLYFHKETIKHSHCGN